jgi:hypothetical protein
MAPTFPVSHQSFSLVVTAVSVPAVIIIPLRRRWGQGRERWSRTGFAARLSGRRAGRRPEAAGAWGGVPATLVPALIPVLAASLLPLGPPPLIALAAITPALHTVAAIGPLTRHHDRFDLIVRFGVLSAGRGVAEPAGGEGEQDDRRQHACAHGCEHRRR